MLNDAEKFELKNNIIADIKSSYYLVSKEGFLATFLALILIAGGVGWASGRTAFGNVIEEGLVSDIENGAIEARSLIKGNHRLPQGAVIAVTGGNHVDDIEDNCPAGWSVFQSANGRFIIGAGKATNDTSLRTPMVIGGSETTPHTVPAEHQHAMFASTPAGAKRYPKKGEVIARSASYGGAGLVNENFEYQIRPGKGKAVLGANEKVGSNSSLPNMPPFIALTFCEKN